MSAKMFNLRTPSKLIIASLFFALAMSAPRIVHAASLAQTTDTTAGETVRIMVKVDPAANNEEMISVLSESANADNMLPQVGWEIIEVNAAAAPAMIAELQATQGVLEVTPDYPLELAWEPNDPAYAQGNQWALDKIGTDVAWEFSSGQAITVAVIDSGIDPNHPDLVGRTVPGYNFIDKNTDTTDLCGHGTHVSGIIAAETDNATGMAGIAPRAVIMPIKVIGENCLGNYSRLMQGILYAVDQGVRIISITSGGGFEHTGLHDAIIYARSKGVLVVVAAGNRGSALPFYPGSFEEAFTIAGTDDADNQYNMSNFGQQIDLAAPAVAVYSTYWSSEAGSTYALMTGTSMAAPHVAGVAALILAIDPKLSVEALETALISSATDLGDTGKDQIFGWGRVTAWRAVAAVSPAAGNVRLGHFRVPTMATFGLTAITTTADTDSIQISWNDTEFAVGHSVVVYRSPFPVFESAEDIAEVAAAATGTFSDTAVEADQDYYYWLVDVDQDVEVAITDMISSKLTLTPAAPEEPQQPTKVAMFMPFLNR
jgi:thermitase